MWSKHSLDALLGALQQEPRTLHVSDLLFAGDLKFLRAEQMEPLGSFKHHLTTAQLTQHSACLRAWQKEVNTPLNILHTFISLSSPGLDLVSRGLLRAQQEWRSWFSGWEARSDSPLELETAESPSCHGCGPWYVSLGYSLRPKAQLLMSTAI